MTSDERQPVLAKCPEADSSNSVVVEPDLYLRDLRCKFHQSGLSVVLMQVVRSPWQFGPLVRCASGKLHLVTRQGQTLLLSETLVAGEVRRPEKCRRLSLLLASGRESATKELVDVKSASRGVFETVEELVSGVGTGQLAVQSVHGRVVTLWHRGLCSFSWLGTFWDKDEAPDASP